MFLLGCAAGDQNSVQLPDYFEGADYDAEHPNAPLGGGKADGYPLSYDVPDLPRLERPEVIVSLRGLTVHLFDRATGYSRVYPAGVGVKNSVGESITPSGHFASGDDPNQGWWYVPRRWVPEYFGGLPFLRITAQNSRGYNTYGLHGPITSTLIRGYVSHGCIRMAKDDIVELFYLVRDHPSTPITLQKEVERDAMGAAVDVGSTLTLWKPGVAIQYGESVGPAPWQVVTADS
ncbi:MAG: L,D-transpeptidase, partial [Deltaproteobacteria bacterium]|nr:L,D-transpeptidase [Deltaproteobacteria bacterium]